MALTDLSIRKTKPSAKQVKIADGRGLYLLVHPNGSKYWRMKYRRAGVEKNLAFGKYPDVSLVEARKRCWDAKNLIAQGIDPSPARLQATTAPTFEKIAREWHELNRANWTPEHAGTVLRRIEANLLPSLGPQKIHEIDAVSILAALRQIQNRGAVETAHRVKQICSQVFFYAIATGRATHNPTTALKGALKPVNNRHFPSITDPRQVGELLRAIDDYKGSAVTRCALQLAPRLFVRPGELRHAEWSEFDFDQKQWRIPGTKMKMRSPHIVPLSTQSVGFLRELEMFTGGGKYLFPSIRSAQRPMSENTVNASLRRLGYTAEEMTGHGFRSIASTMLNEQGWNRDMIERQLAHSERDSVRAAYNHAEYLPQRRQMMQSWSDHLEKLKEENGRARLAHETVSPRLLLAEPPPSPQTLSDEIQPLALAFRT
jgi:integrase